MADDDLGVFLCVSVTAATSLVEMTRLPACRPTPHTNSHRLVRRDCVIAFRCPDQPDGIRYTSRLDGENNWQFIPDSAGSVVRGRKPSGSGPVEGDVVPDTVDPNDDYTDAGG